MKRGGVLCDSGAVPLHSEDWVCLHSESSAGGDTCATSRLLSYTVEDSAGWVLCFDIKERSDTVLLLTFIRVMRCTPRGAALPDHVSNEALDTCATDDDGPSVRDCSEFETVSLHSMQDRLLHMFRQPDAGMLELSFWNAMSRGGISATSTLPQLHGSLVRGECDVQAARSALGAPGYAALGQLPWTDIGVSMTALSDTMECLQDHGFPPVFIFMYDQAWLLLAHLFGLARRVLSSEDVHMSLSVFAWSLRSGEDGGGRVGSNFGRPHRDQAYRSCHTPEGQLSMITTWVPLVPVTERSGCMFVVPAASDPLIRCGDHPSYMRPAHGDVGPVGRALPCGAGDILMWRADLVHWGSACSQGAERPRKSVSTMFMLPSCDKVNTASLSELFDSGGWTVEVRLRTILRSLLRYQEWHPGFDGMPFADKDMR